MAQADPSELLVASAAYAGCGLSVATDGRLHESTDLQGATHLSDLGGCTYQWETLPDRIRTEGIDIVLAQIGAWDGADIHLADGEVVSVLTSRGAEIIADAYRSFATSAEDAGARVVWVLPADVELGWGRFETAFNDPMRWASLRAIVRSLGVQELDLGGWLEAEGLDGPDGRPDGVHLSPEAQARFIDEIIVPALLVLGPSGHTG
jgi:hypothetical protein